MGGLCRLITGADIVVDELDHQTQVDQHDRIGNLLCLRIFNRFNPCGNHERRDHHHQHLLLGQTIPCKGAFETHQPLPEFGVSGLFHVVLQKRHAEILSRRQPESG